VVEETLPDLHYEKYVPDLRVRRLHELALHVKPEDIDPSFNPQDYKNYFRTNVEGPP